MQAHTQVQPQARAHVPAQDQTQVQPHVLIPKTHNGERQSGLISPELSVKSPDVAAVEMAFNTAEGGGSLLGKGGGGCLDIAVNQRIHSDFASQLARRRMESSRRNPLGQPDTETAQACSEHFAMATRPLRLATEINRNVYMGEFLKWVDGQTK